MNRYAELGQRIARMDGWDNVEISENGFSVTVDPLEHDESGYRELAKDMPRLAAAMLEFAESEAQDILRKMNRRLEKNGLAPQGLTDGLDETRDAIADAFAALDEIDEDNGDYPDYNSYQFSVDGVKFVPDTGKIMLECDFNGARAITEAPVDEDPGKTIDRLYAGVFGHGEKEKGETAPKP